MTNPEDDLSRPFDARLAALVEAITDGNEVDWESAEAKAANADERDLIGRLRVIAGVVQVHRSGSDAVTNERQPGGAYGGWGSDRSTREADVPSRTQLTSWGPLTIRTRVGSGSFGTVFMAWDPRLEREVALKLLRDVPSIDKAAAAAVINEGRLLAKIRHPNVVTVLGADYFEGTVGLWMEFIKGRTLDTILHERGRYSPEEAEIVGLDLCRALAAVHRAGFLHGDIKAQNVMRESGGRIVLMDFGAARVVNVSGEVPSKILGTPLYMAPEVMRGDAPTVQSDLYSLGILLYHLVTGVFPVTGVSFDGLREEHSHGRRRLLRDVRPDLPSAFVGLVDVATAALPQQRPESAGALEALLEDAVGHRRLRRPAASANYRDDEPDLGQSIAVLPFIDLSPDKSLEYFCDGIAEEIINSLTSVSGVRVVARSSAFQFKGRTEDVRHVGSALNVSTVLEGSVRASGKKLRVIARLIDTADDRQLWSERFERSLGAVFAVQDEIARAAVGALRARAGTETLSAGVVPSTPTTRDLEAYTLYLKGRHYWNKRTEAALRKSVDCFQASVERDPNYAEGFAGLAEAHATMGLYGVLPPNEVMPRAMAAAQRAVEILDTLSGPFATLGCVASVHGWQWREAERHYRRAIDLNPKHPSAHHWYAINYLVPLKRFDEADNELQRAVDVDPLSMPIRVSLGLRFYFAHQYEKARHELQNSFELEPGSGLARLFLGLTLVEMGRYDDAIHELNLAIQLADSPEMTAALGYASARAGNIDRAQETLGELIETAGQRYISPSLIAQVHAGLGNTVASIDWLEKAGDVRAADLGWLAVRPVFDNLRRETRFNALLERLGQ